MYWSFTPPPPPPPPHRCPRVSNFCTYRTVLLCQGALNRLTRQIGPHSPHTTSPFQCEMWYTLHNLLKESGWWYIDNTRRINTEEMAKVVAAILEQYLFNSLPRYLFCTRDDLKNRMNSSFSFKSSLCNSSSYSNCPGAK